MPSIFRGVHDLGLLYLKAYTFEARLPFQRCGLHPSSLIWIILFKACVHQTSKIELNWIVLSCKYICTWFKWGEVFSKKLNVIKSAFVSSPFIHSCLIFFYFWTKVTCKERYSDLEKNIYLPSPKNGGFSKKTFMYDDGYDVTKTEEFVSLHPCAQLGAKQVGNHADSCFLFNFI